MILADLKETYSRRLLKDNENQKSDVLIKSEQNYKETCVNYTDFREQLAYAFYILSKNIANYAKFNGVDIEDAIQEGVLICFEKIDKFDHRKGKAFNYMTTCILNHCRQLYRSARNYNEFKKRYHNILQERFENFVIRNGKTRSNSWKSGIDQETNSW